MDRSRLIVLVGLILLFAAIFTLDATVFRASGLHHYLPYLAVGLIVFLIAQGCGRRCCGRAKQ